MNRIRLVWAALAVMASWMLAACDSEDTTATESSGDCIVTAARMGSLSCVRYTQTEAGADSAYNVTVQGTYYPLSIDNVNGRIYNADSLPVGTDVSRVAFSTFNASGIAAIRSLVTGEDTIFSMSDSTDFTLPRQITVYAANGAGQRTYTVDIRVHQEEADTFRWSKAAAGNEMLAALRQPRLLVKDGRLLAFGSVSGSPALLTASTSVPGTWEYADLGEAAPEPASVQLMGGKFYGIARSGIVRSDDGAEWEAVPTDFVAQSLVAAGSGRLYALSGGKLYSSPDGASWQEETMDVAGLFPTAGFAACYNASPVDNLIENLLLIGNHPDGPVVWKKVNDLTGFEYFPWTHLPSEAENPYPCPDLQEAALTAYDGGAVLAGREQDGTCALYVTRDLGRTWKPGEIMMPPAGTATGCAVASGDEGYLWILLSGTGDVWKGRFNRLGWDAAAR